jgi:c-di-GMP-related signal transduction protein
VDARPIAARQPIFDVHQRVFGYELLFRSGFENCFTSSDGDFATSRVLDSFMLQGLETLWRHQRAFINFTANALLNSLATLLPVGTLTVEILENVEPDPPVVAACLKLKELGYPIALDDVTSLERQKPLLDLADIIKIDFSLIGKGQQREIARRLRRRRVKLLAEKVETSEQFKQAVSWGYDYFQGFFFCKPQVISAREVPAFKVAYLQLLRAVNRPELDFREIERVLQHDLSLSYRLLRYLNSPLFGLRTEIRSLRQAVSLLGEQYIKRWAALLSTMMLASDKPAELLIASLTRARFCELLSTPLARKHEPTDFFLTGLFSLIDTILDRPMEEILDGLDLATEIKVCLSGGHNLHREVYECVLAVERADWDALTQRTAKLGLDDQFVASCYLQSVEWANEVFGQQATGSGSSDPSPQGTRSLHRM